jgi:hypothetical protein
MSAALFVQSAESMSVGADPSSGDVATIAPVVDAGLGAGFFDAVAMLGSRHKTDPKIFLLVWCAESGLNPAAVNPNGNARGLNQMMPQTLAYFGAPAAFDNISGVDQLPWIEKFITWTETLNHGPFRSPVRCYVANFIPAALARPDAMDTVIADRDSVDTTEAAAYAKNAGLDLDHDGKITQRDIARHLVNVRHGYEAQFAKLAAAVARLDPSLITWPKTSPALGAGEASASSAPSSPLIAGMQSRVGRDALGFTASALLFVGSIVWMNRARYAR